MQLKPEALNALKLPVKVKAGFLGSVKLKVRANIVFLIIVLNYFLLNVVQLCLGRNVEKFDFISISWSNILSCSKSGI